MRNIISLILLVILFSCNKEKDEIPELINYGSEIFTGSDTLIYGSWAFLKSFEGWNGRTTWGGDPFYCNRGL